MKDFSEYPGAMWLLYNNPECYTIPVEGYTLYAYDTLEECESVVIGTRILGVMGIPVQDVELGIYKGRYVVASKDYMKDSERFMTLRSLLYLVGKASDDLSDITKKLGKLKYHNKEYVISWFWSIIVADGLLGYSGRTLDNVGVLCNVNNHNIRVCPILGGNKGFYFSRDNRRMETVLKTRANIKLKSMTCGCSGFRYENFPAMFWDLVKYCDIEEFRRSVQDCKVSVEFDKVYSAIDSTECVSLIKKKLAKECFYTRYHMLCEPDKQY